MTPRVQHQSVSVQGRGIHYLERPGRAPSDPTLVLLHGFPECADAWLPVLDALDRHVRVIIPDLPGFGDSQPLSEEAGYRAGALAARLADFIQRVARDPVHLVGHDWGGAIAWPLAAFYPDRLYSLCIINAAHPTTFVRELKTNPHQREKSIYINTLNKPGMAQELAGREFRLLKRIMGDSLQRSGDAYARKLQANWSDTTRLDAMLAYYRNMPQGVPRDDNEAQALHIPELHVAVPVQVLWGCQDRAFVPEVLDGLEDVVSELQVLTCETASHWLHRERPDWVAQQLMAHLAAHQG